MELKYIVFEDGTFVLFPDKKNHSDFASAGTPSSAGFVKIYGPNEVFCYGESLTLKIKSESLADAALIKKELYPTALDLYDEITTSK